MIPLNIETYTKTFDGISTTTIFQPQEGDLNIVYSVQMQQEKDLSDTFVTCGDIEIAYNYGKDYPQVNTFVDCGNNPVEVHKTGQDEAFVLVQMLNDQPIYTQYSTTSTSTRSNLTPDGILVSFFLLNILLLLLVYFLVRALSNMDIKRRYTGNNTIEGKEKIEY